MRRIREGCEYGDKGVYGDNLMDMDNLNTPLNYANPNTLPNNQPLNNNFIYIDDLLTPYDSTSLDNDSNLYFDLNRKKQQIMNNSIEIKSKFDSLEDKKKKINEEGERRLELLKRYHLDTYNAVIWLRDNKSLFSKEIIEPTFLHLNITNEKFTPEIEVFLSFILMTSFICKDPNDFIKFMKKMKDEKNLRINAIEEIKGYNTDGGSKVGKGNSNLTNNNNNTLFKSLGFDGVILDFINVRNETKDFLIAHGHFDSIPLTKSLLNDKNIFEKSSIKRFAMNSKFFEIKRSRYNDKDFIIHSSSINPKNLFTKKIDTTEIENELKKLDFDRKINEMDLNKILNEIEDLNLKINIKKKEKNSFDKDLNFIKISLDDKGNDDVIEIVKDKDDTLNTTQIPQSLNTTQPNISLSTQMKLLPNTIEELNSEIIKEKTQLKFINVSEESKIEYENKKNQLDKIANELENTTNTKKSYEDRIKEIKKGVIKELVNLTEKIDKEFQKLFKEMGCEGKIEFVYEKNGGCVNGGSSKVGGKVGDNSKGGSKVGDNHNDHSLNNINDTNLNNNTNTSPTLPCKNWKLNILVKFREKEKLEILSSFRQSGGEKSVSTILFLLALQKVDTSPFRLVDEINQGMDKDNEKSILNILFKMNLNEKTQFFIISPKLVEGLDYNENMKIIILFSDQPGAVKRAFLRGR
ncbi:Structural maintenance of chromosomes protein 5, partial [Nosema bombycis CQ1]